MYEDRKANLKRFVDWCKQHITGDEKGEAQIFLDRLFQSFGQKGSLDVGGTPELRIRKSSEDGGGTSFADYVWKPIVLIEMKKRGTDLSRHYRQAFDYWTRLVPGRPRYVVLCNFDEFQIYDFDTQLDTPKDTVKLTELADRWPPLAFLFPTNEKPHFDNDREAVTRKAADALAECFNKLIVRKVDHGLAQRFVLQTLVALFAEDIDLIPKNFLVNLLDDMRQPSDAFDLLGGLFEAMNTPPPRGTPPWKPGRPFPSGISGGRYKGIPYFNGGIFRDPARLPELHPDEANQIRAAARENWAKVSPEIFGALFQDSMGKEERHAFGAHFTHPSDIMKIVKPTISDPWTAAIESAKSAKRLEELSHRLSTLRVLDPACGSGNFLYLAYREMKRLESRIRERLATDFPGSQTPLSTVTLRQFFGLDINKFAIELAKITITIARKLAIDELHIIDESPLPLDNLDDNFLASDALLTKPMTNPPSGDTVRAEWPPADVIIGNPPFLDARKLTVERGREYVGDLDELYPEIARRADYCTYWFRKTHDHLPLCTLLDPLAGRAGLVGTQNIRNNEAREGSLDYIVTTGTIVDAVENQPWTGEAQVTVSIVNWVKTQDPKLVPAKKTLWKQVKPEPGARPKRRREFELKAYYRDFINSSLSDATDVAATKVLECNRSPKVVFEGIQTGHDGFVVGEAEADRLIEKNAQYALYVKPFLNGTDLLSGRYSVKREYVVDMSDLDLLQASALPDLIAIPRERVLPDWQEDARKEQEATQKATGEHQNRLDCWWALKRPRNDLQAAIRRLPRYIACSAVTVRPIFVFLASNYLPTNALKVFAFSDDYSFGVIQSFAHASWFVAKGSKFEERPRYTPESVFDTFPWPQSPTKVRVEAVASAAVELRRVRSKALQSLKGGLRALYKTLQLPGKNPLKDAHAALDSAVLAAYNFDPKADLLSQLLDLNLRVAGREETGLPVTAPGVPPFYGDPTSLITDDCIRP